MSEETCELKPFDRRKGRPCRTDPDAAFVTHLCDSPVRDLRPHAGFERRTEASPAGRLLRPDTEEGKAA